jgi:hexokinase
MSDTADHSALILSDPTDELLTVVGIFSHFFGIETTDEERQFFRQLAVLIGTRAARLSACGIAAIVSKKGYLEDGCAVGADGSLYNVSVVNCGTRQYRLIRILEIPQLCQQGPHRPR